MKWESILTAFPGVKKKILLNLNLMAGSIHEHGVVGLAAGIIITVMDCFMGCPSHWRVWPRQAVH